MISFKNVSKYFKGVQVLNELTFTVPEGQTCALLGLSGSGKTTALKLICGLHTPDSGEVTVNGMNVDPSTVDKVRSSIGYVIQDGGLFPHLTALKNLQLVGREAGWSAAKIDERIEELTVLAQLRPNLIAKYPRELSGGQRQRIGLMRALMRNPPILLLDEPLGALDPITRSELQLELRDLCRRLNKTVVLVTHDLFEAGYLGDRILLLNEGRIIQQGTLFDLTKAPANEFVQRFVESQKRVEA
jgi:osmoprotectant transport system ATP-binding protein